MVLPRVANRIAEGRFTLDGKEYNLTKVGRVSRWARWASWPGVHGYLASTTCWLGCSKPSLFRSNLVKKTWATSFFCSYGS